jgi:hypothetical protein
MVNATTCALVFFFELFPGTAVLGSASGVPGWECDRPRSNYMRSFPGTAIPGSISVPGWECDHSKGLSSTK